MRVTILNHFPKGKILHVCPAKSKCLVHYPQKKQRQEVKRSERLVQEKENTEKETRLLTAVEWGKQLLEQETLAIKEQLQEYFLLYGFEALYRASSTLPLLHSEFHSILKKVSKEEEVCYEVDKLKRQLQITGLNKK